MEVVPLNLHPNDLRWLAQTVHQAYHTEPGNAARWQDCSKSVCKWAFDTLLAHDRLLHEQYAPKDVAFEQVWSR